MTLKIEVFHNFGEVISSYRQIPMIFETDTIFEIVLLKDGIGGFNFHEKKLDSVFTKDYDAIDGDGPDTWAQKFNLENWGFLLTKIDDEVVGGAAIAFATPDLHMLEGRDDMAVLWDIRISPHHQRKGIGNALFARAVDWAKERGCKVLKIETQNNNTNACKFYLNQGCELGGINRFAYSDFPEEVQLLWYKNLI